MSAIFFRKTKFNSCKMDVFSVAEHGFYMFCSSKLLKAHEYGMVSCLMTLAAGPKANNCAKTVSFSSPSFLCLVTFLLIAIK